MADQDIKAPTEEVEAMTIYLLEKIKEYVQTNQVQMISVFMACHSAHKIVVNDLAKRWTLEGIPIDKTARMADMTWRKAMKELWRSGIAYTPDPKETVNSQG